MGFGNGVYSELGVHYLGCILYGVEVHYLGWWQYLGRWALLEIG